MTRISQILLFFLVILSAIERSGFAQTRHIDSLKLALKNAKHDTTRSSILYELTESAPDGEWEKYNEQLKAIAENNLKVLSHTNPQSLLFKKYLATSLNNIGIIYKNQADLPRALQYYGKSLKIKEEIGDKRGIANSLSIIAGIYQNQADIPKALDYYGKSLKIMEEIGDKSGVANSFNNIGSVYQNQGEIAKALEYALKSLKIKEEIGDKRGIANAFNNIGYVFTIQGDYTKALEYYDKCLKIKEEIGDKKGVALSLNNIGGIYQIQGDLVKALDYIRKSLKIKEEIGDKKGSATSLINIGIIYLEQKNYARALDFYTQSMKLSREIAFPEQIKNAANQFYKLYKATGNYKLCLVNYELFIQMRDSINNEKTRKASIKNQLKYEYEKKAAADSVAHAKESEIKNVELEKQKVEIAAKKNQQYALFGGLGLVMIFAGFMYNRFKITQKQKVIIEHQKEIVEEQKKIVEEKQKEVLDSIHYARRIQMALIPTEKQVEKILQKFVSK